MYIYMHVCIEYTTYKPLSRYHECAMRFRPLSARTLSGRNSAEAVCGLVGEFNDGQMMERWKSVNI